MLAKYFSIAAAVASLVSAYTTPTTMCTDACNPIAHPGLNEAVPAGTTFSVTWNPTTTGTVTILLLRGPATNLIVLNPIAQNIPNSGVFSWSVPTTLVPDTTHYGIQLINDADGTFQYSTQFGISNPSYSSSASASSMSISSSTASTLHSSASGAPVTSANITTVTSAALFPTGVVGVYSSGGAGVYSSGGTFTNTSIVSPTIPMSVPSTLQAATSTGSSSAPTATAKSGADTVKMSIGGAVLAFAAAVVAL